MSRVETETERMTRLVEDLLLLARLDSGRPLERETVDLSRVAVDAVCDAQVAGPDHRWELDLPEEPVMVRRCCPAASGAGQLTGQRPTRIPPGNRGDTLHLAPPHAALNVSDNGPGIPVALPAEVFQRFARGDSSRSPRAAARGWAWRSSPRW